MEQKYYWNIFIAVGNKCLIGSSSYNALGIIVYNSEDDSCTKFYDSNYDWRSIVVSNTRCLLSGKTTSSSGTGLLVYDSETNEFTRISTLTTYWYDVYFKISDTRFFAGGYYSSSGSLDIYDLETNSIIKSIYGSGWKYFTQVSPTKWLIAGSSDSSWGSSGIYLYNLEDDTATKKYSGGILWKYYKQVSPTKWLITSSTGNSSYTYTRGVLLYNGEDDTIKQKSSTGYDYDTFTEDNGNYYIENSEKKYSYSKNILYYNSADDTVKLVKYYLGEI